LPTTSFNNIPDHLRQQIWETSPYLNTAFWQYQREDVRKKYKALEAEGGALASYNAFAKNMEDPDVLNSAKKEIEKTSSTDIGILDFIGTMAIGLKTIGEQSVPEKKAEYDAFSEKCKNLCKQWIKDGALIALGFSKYRRPEDQASIVPKDLISHGSFKWNENRIIHRSLEMIDIRITSANRLQQLIDSSKTATPNPSEPPQQKIKNPNLPNPPLGRPTKKELILRAYELGIENNAINFSQSKKLIFDTVREIIRTQWPEEFEGGKGLGFTPMRKCLSDKIDRNKLK
jgi:hypothetical protein